MKSSYSAKLSYIASLIGGTLYGDDVLIKALTTDSRESGPEDLYIPIKGEHFDGHDFIQPLMEEGMAAAFLSEKRIDKGTPSYVLCEDSCRALGMLAAEQRRSFTSPVIGITGTNGKTTCKELLSCALGAKYSVHRNRKNYNNHIGVPFTLFDISKSHTAAVIEMGMNHPGEISYLTSMVKPDAAVITNADAGHLEFLGSVENVAAAKSEIFESMKEGSPVFINRDTPTYNILAANADKKNLKIISYGTSTDADIRPDSFELTTDSIEMTYHGVQCTVPMYGVHNVNNLLVALAVAEYYDVSPSDASDALLMFKNEAMRNQIHESAYTVINDAYNANPLSVKSALQSMSLVFPGKRKIAVLGDMKELGELSRQYHIEAGSDCARFGVDFVFVTGQFKGALAEGARLSGMDSVKVREYDTKDVLIDELKALLREGDVVLVKGSRSMKMEEVADAIVC